MRPNEITVKSFLLSASVIINELSLIQMFPACENILHFTKQEIIFQRTRFKDTLNSFSIFLLNCTLKYKWWKHVNFFKKSNTAKHWKDHFQTIQQSNILNKINTFFTNVQLLFWWMALLNRNRAVAILFVDFFKDCLYFADLSVLSSISKSHNLKLHRQKTRDLNIIKIYLGWKEMEGPYI